MTKRFRSGLAKNDEFSDEIIDELTGKHYFDSTKDDYVFSEEIVDLLNELNDENNELKQVLMKVLNQLYNAESSLIYEYSTSIVEDEKQLEIEFKEKYGKYGWEE